MCPLTFQLVRSQRVYRRRCFEPWYHRFMESTSSTLQLCLLCGNSTKNPKFCSRSCSASYNNSVAPKRTRKIHRCSTCGKPSRNPTKSGLCFVCYQAESSAVIGRMTLGEAVITTGKPSDRYNGVRYHGRKNRALGDSCQVCGYDKAVQVCHIKPIPSFPLDTLISVINDPSNIAILCPNHHWELDHGMLTL